MKFFWYEIKKITNLNKKEYIWSSRLSSLFDSWLVISSNTFYDLYKSNWDIRQAIRKISNSVSRNWIYLVDNKKKALDNEDLNEEILSYFKSPTFLKWKTELFKNYLLSWELYILPSKNLKWETAGFQIIDSRAVSKQTDGKWNIVNFQINTWHGQCMIKTPEEIAFFKLEDDINNTINWMGLLNGVLYDWLSDLEASKTNYALYQNSAIPSAMLLLDWDLSSNEQQIAKEMFESQFRGSNNQHKTLIGWWIKDIKTLSITPRDMEFINQRHLTTEKISAVFWVPKSILWYVDTVNYANWQELRREFIEWTIRPYEIDLEHIMNHLMQMFLPEIWNKYWIKCDWEQLEEQQEWFESQRKDVETWIITINEARIDRWLEPIKEENCDKLLISRNVVLLEDIALDAVLPVDEG
mgnify:CR=1 FL=1